METSDRQKLPIDRPCSACSDGDYKMEHHQHTPPFRVETPEPTPPETSVAKTSPASVETLAEIKARAEKATPGPWTTEKPVKDADGWSTGVCIGATMAGKIWATPPGGHFPSNDRDFIAHARTDIPALVATVEAQAAELKRARAILVESVLAIGGYAEERTSLDFLAHLPEEIKLRYKRTVECVTSNYKKGYREGLEQGIFDGQMDRQRAETAERTLAALRERNQQLEQTLRELADVVKEWHPDMRDDEPCIVQQAWSRAERLLNADIRPKTSTAPVEG